MLVFVTYSMEKFSIQSLVYSQGKGENLHEKGKLFDHKWSHHYDSFFLQIFCRLYFHDDVECTKLVKPQKFCSKGAVLAGLNGLPTNSES